MPRADKSVALLTGMIIAALYVVLLVGFTRESYMRRDAAARMSGETGWTAVHDVSKRVCRIESTLCAPLSADVAERQICASPIDALRRLIGGPMVPLTLEGIRRAMPDEPR